jgi:hypothetical protein
VGHSEFIIWTVGEGFVETVLRLRRGTSLRFRGGSVAYLLPSVGCLSVPLSVLLKGLQAS